MNTLQNRISQSQLDERRVSPWLDAALMADCMLTCGAIVKENPIRVEMLSADLQADLMHPSPFQFMRATPPFYVWSCR